MNCAWRVSIALRVARWWARRSFTTHVRAARWLRVLLHLPLRSRRRIIQRNLQVVYPDRDEAFRAALLRDNVESSLLGLSELLRAWSGESAWFRDHYRIEGLQHVHDAQAQGRGVLLFTGHFMHTELTARAITEAMAQPVRVVVRRNNSVCMETFLERARAAVFGPSIEKKDVRGMLRVLKDGGLLMLSADQDFNYQHSFVPFFGIPAATLHTTPELVARADAIMLPTWCWRDSQGVYHVEIGASWPQWSAEDLPGSAALYLRELEQRVRAHPEQYLWMHRRFKTRPTDEESFYG